MALDLDLPTTQDDERLRKLQLLTPQAISPANVGNPVNVGDDELRAMYGADTDLGRKVRGMKPLDAENSSEKSVNAGLQPLGSASSGLKPLSTGATEVEPIGTGGEKEKPAIGSSADYQGRLQTLRDKDANPWGSPNNHPGFLGKLAHIGAKIGETAGNIVAPSVMQLIPGTTANRQLEELSLEKKVGEAQSRESQDAARKATAQHQTNEEGIAKEGQRLEQERIDEQAEQNAKPKNIDEAAIRAKTKETNPATGKPFTEYEARVQLAQDLQDTRPQAGGRAQTVTMLDKEGGKPFLYEYDAQGNYSGDQGYGNWKKVGPAQPNAAALGLIGTIQPLIDPRTGQIVGTMNSKTGQMSPLTQSQAAVVGSEGAGTSASGARVASTARNQFQTQVLNPANDTETQYRRAQHAIEEYNANPQTGAPAMVIFAQHLGTTLGGIKGAAIGEGAQDLHRNAIGLEDRIGRYIDYLGTGQPLSENQVREFYSLIQATRQLKWEVTAHTAAQRHQPVDFLPDDVEIPMRDAKGEVRKVRGNENVQRALDHGIKIAF